jgi:hypothetical protein
LRTLTVTWNGTAWNVTPSPSPGGEALNRLEAVSCVTPRFCVAVGTYREDDAPDFPFHTLVETWDGTRWRVTPSPTLPGCCDFVYLYGVSCVSTSWCVAVGTDSYAGRSLIETWDGNAWKVVQRRRIGIESGFWSVSCTSRKWCVAVGFYIESDGSPLQGLVESWDGDAWKVASLPGPQQFEYPDVSCATSRSCVVVADYYDAALASNQPLIESWDGTTWTAIPSPDPTSSAISLSSVSCATPTSCSAVGSYAGGNPPRVRTLALHTQRNM